MITIIKGSLLDAKEDILVHQVNCQGVMGSGVAYFIKQKWPEVYRQYRDFINDTLSSEDNIAWHIGNNESKLLGLVNFAHTDPYNQNPNEPQKMIANLFGQDSYSGQGGRFTNYEALYKGLEIVNELAKFSKQLAKYPENQKHSSVAMPYKIGCGLGGGTWDIVYAMIKAIFTEVDVTIYDIEP
jgi:O-acetyl-ADP-ribose deacetylase (regulator of RNase III)